MFVVQAQVVRGKDRGVENKRSSISPYNNSKIKTRPQVKGVELGMIAIDTADFSS